MAAQRPRGRNGRRAKAAASPLSLRERVGVRGGRESLRVSRSPRLPVACANRGGCAAKCLRSTWNPPARIPFFFRPTPALGRPPIRRAGRRRRRIFLADNHFGPDTRLTSVDIDGRNAPLARGVANHFAGHYLAQCPNRATPSGTVRQSARTFWKIVRFRRARFGTMCFSSGRFPAQCRFCGAISGTMSIARDYKSDKVNFETRFRRDLRPKRKTKCASEPLARPPSSVETPVCRPMRRTPSAAAHACWEAGGGGLVVVQETT